MGCGDGGRGLSGLPQPPLGLNQEVLRVSRAVSGYAWVHLVMEIKPRSGTR